MVYYRLKYLILLLLVSGIANSETLYSSRPHIDTLPAQAIAQPPIPNWALVKFAFGAYTAELLALYPDSHIYFLARDSEYLYDTALGFLKNDPKARTKLHLLPVSRLNMGNANARAFLEQEGLSAHSMGNQSAVLVDLGWRGTIPNGIMQTLDPSVSVKTVAQHVTSSSGNGIPSSRVFLSLILPPQNINIQTPDAHHQNIVQVEHVPHWTQRTNGFTQTGYKIEASAPGLDNPGNSQLLMQDIKFFTEDPAQQKWFDVIREDMSVIAQAAQGKIHPQPQELADRFQRLKENNIFHFEHDLQDAASNNYRRLHLQHPSLQSTIVAASIPGNSQNLKKGPAAYQPKITNIKDLTSGELHDGSLLKNSKEQFIVLKKFPHKKSGATTWYIVENTQTKTQHILTIPNSGVNTYSPGNDEEEDKEFVRARERIKYSEDVSSNPLGIHIGTGYILTDLPKNWETGREWLKKFETGATPNKDIASLFTFLHSLANEGVYFGELTRDNLIYDGNEWHMIDSGAKKKYDSKKALKRYVDKFASRWGQALVDAFANSSAQCARLLAEIQ